MDFGHLRDRLIWVPGMRVPVRIFLRELVPCAYGRNTESMRTVWGVCPAGRDSISAAAAGEFQIDSFRWGVAYGWESFLKPHPPPHPPEMSGFPVISGGIPGSVPGDSPGVPGNIPGGAQGVPGSASEGPSSQSYRYKLPINRLCGRYVIEKQS